MSESLATRSIHVIDCVDGLPIAGAVETTTDTRSDGMGCLRIASHATKAAPLHIRAPGYHPVDVSDPAGDVVLLQRDVPTVYLDKLAYRRGESIAISATTTRPARIELVRHGVAAEIVATHELAPSGSATHQITDRHVRTGFDWVDGIEIDTSDSDRWTAGLYSCRVVDDQGVAVQAAPFVIESTDEEIDGTRPVVVANTNTWIAYNFFGGRSRYRSATELISERYAEIDRLVDPDKATSLRRASTSALRKAFFRLPPRLRTIAMDARQRAGAPRSNDAGWLTARRPMHSPGLLSTAPTDPYLDHLAGGEWRFLAWLEREQLDYAIVADTSVGDRSAALTATRAICLSTHSEYWTETDWAALLRLHEHNRCWLLNLSGNSLFAAVDRNDDGAVRWTGEWIEHARSDALRLRLGLALNVPSTFTCAGFSVTDPGHWLWGDTFAETQNPSLIGTRTLITSSPVSDLGVDGNIPGNGRATLLGEGGSGWELDTIMSGDYNIVATGVNGRGGAQIAVAEPVGTRGGRVSIPSITFTSTLLIDNYLSDMTRRAIKTAAAAASAAALPPRSGQTTTTKNQDQGSVR